MPVLRRRTVVPRCPAHAASCAARGGGGQRHPAGGEEKMQMLTELHDCAFEKAVLQTICVVTSVLDAAGNRRGFRMWPACL